jgi:hypothetical protein
VTPPPIHILFACVAQVGSVELKKHVMVITELLINDPHPTCRGAAVRLTGSFGLASFKHMVPKLVERMCEDNDYTRDLGCNDGYGHIRTLVAKLLATRLGPRGLHEYASHFLPLVTRNDKPEVQKLALKLLALLEPPPPREQLGAVVKLVESTGTRLDVVVQARSTHATALALKTTAPTLTHHPPQAMTTLAAGGMAEHIEMLIAKQLASTVPQRQAAALTTLCKTLKGAELAQHAGAMLKMIHDLKVKRDVLVKAFEKLGLHLTDHIDELVALIDHADMGRRLTALKVLAKCEGKALRDHKEPISKCLDDSDDSIVAAAFSAMAAFEPAELEPFRNRILEARHAL